MDEKFIKEARQKAERSVADMPDGDLKVKAFEVTYKHLLTTSTEGISTSPNGKTYTPSKSSPSKSGRSNTLSERILTLQSEGFFNTPQVIGAIREGLQVYGWHYPVTTLSGTLQGLVQRRKLRRERVKDKNKFVWKYSNP